MIQDEMYRLLNDNLTTYNKYINIKLKLVIINKNGYIVL